MRFVFLSLLVLFSALGYAGQNHDHTHSGHSHSEHSMTSTSTTGNLVISNPRAQATIPGIKVASGYMSLLNKGNKTIRLIAAESPASNNVEFHSMIMQGSKMSMRKMDAIVIKPNETFEISPHKFHLMFTGLKQPFQAGKTVDVTLIGEKGKKYKTSLYIMKMDSHH